MGSSWKQASGTILPSTQVTNTRPVGQIRPSTLFYPARHCVSTRWQPSAPCPSLRSSCIYTVLKLHSALWRQCWGWCGPLWTCPSSCPWAPKNSTLKWSRNSGHCLLLKIVGLWALWTKWALRQGICHSLRSCSSWIKHCFLFHWQQPHEFGFCGVRQINEKFGNNEGLSVR